MASFLSTGYIVNGFAIGRWIGYQNFIAPFALARQSIVGCLFFHWVRYLIRSTHLYDPFSTLRLIEYLHLVFDYVNILHTHALARADYRAGILRLKDFFQHNTVTCRVR
jgi:hypothetical protein